jgi:hypothetical protein
MADESKAQQLRDLLRLAKQLRQHVSDTSDPRYIDLFLEAATALEARAKRLAHGEEPPSLRHIDLLC